MSASELENATRKIFHTIHSEHAKDANILNRIRRLISCDDLKVPGDYFRGKTCADIGCGSAVPGTLNLLDLGAAYVHAMDVDDTIVGTAGELLSAELSFSGRWQIDLGTLAKLPYPDEKFDFVLCQGVIHHVDDDLAALTEIHRVLKNGSQANLVVHGSGGIILRVVMEVMRDEYLNKKDFRQTIDTMTADWFSSQIDWLIARVDDDGSAAYRNSISLLMSLRQLLDKDFALTVQDRLQAPKYKMYDEGEWINLLRRAGFNGSYRVSRKPTYSNVRKILAPLYYEYDAPLARLLYGTGILNFMVTK